MRCSASERRANGERTALNGAPAQPPATWPAVVAAAEQIKAKNVTKYAVTTSWPTWVHFEQFAAIHNLPYATEADGFKGLDTKLLIDHPSFVANLRRC
jgi:sn-glycerol 3-phosphate transport system substrate-binding protein